VTTHLKLLSTLAVQGALPELVARYQAGTIVDVRFAPTHALLERIAAGETADAAIITRAALNDLAAKGVMRADSVTDIAISHVGIAVRAGAPKPDISSVEALKAALLDAESIAYSKIGASGLFFAELMGRLGLTDAVNRKAIVIPGGLTGEFAARGEAEIAVQQVSELMMVRGVDIVGPLPPGADGATMFSAGIFAASRKAEAARSLLAYLRSADAAPVLTKAGLEPAAQSVRWRG
jgi:molybdate transport system substrate-binding protein